MAELVPHGAATTGTASIALETADGATAVVAAAAGRRAADVRPHAAAAGAGTRAADDDADHGPSPDGADSSDSEAEDAEHDVDADAAVGQGVVQSVAVSIPDDGGSVEDRSEIIATALSEALRKVGKNIPASIFQQMIRNNSRVCHHISTEDSIDFSGSAKG